MFSHLIVCGCAGVELVAHQHRGGVVLGAVGALAHPLALLGHEVSVPILHKKNKCQTVFFLGSNVKTTST